MRRRLVRTSNNTKRSRYYPVIVIVNQDIMACGDNPDNSTVWIRTGCIFTYDGNLTDSLLNYSVLLLNLTYCCYYYTNKTTTATAPLVSVRNDQRMRGGDGTLSAAGGSRSVVLLFLLLAGVTAFQWILCLIVGCSGISIIWCALCGWIVHGLYSDTRTNHNDHNPPQEPDSGRIIISTNDDDNNNNVNNNDSSNETPIIIAEEDDHLFTGTRSPRLSLAVGVLQLVDVATIVYYAITAEMITTVAHICALILGASLHLCFSSRRWTTTSSLTTAATTTTTTTSGTRTAMIDQNTTTNSTTALLPGEGGIYLLGDTDNKM
jgi:hypothetical protein